jgi:hypothetical protein
MCGFFFIAFAIHNSAKQIKATFITSGHLQFKKKYDDPI